MENKGKRKKKEKKLTQVTVGLNTESLEHYKLSAESQNKNLSKYIRELIEGMESLARGKFEFEKKFLDEN